MAGFFCMCLVGLNALLGPASRNVIYRVRFGGLLVYVWLAVESSPSSHQAFEPSMSPVCLFAPRDTEHGVVNAIGATDLV